METQPTTVVFPVQFHQSVKRALDRPSSNLIILSLLRESGIKSSSPPPNHPVVSENKVANPPPSINASRAPKAKPQTKIIQNCMRQPTSHASSTLEHRVENPVTPQYIVKGVSSQQNPSQPAPSLVPYNCQIAPYFSSRKPAHPPPCETNEVEEQERLVVQATEMWRLQSTTVSS